MQNTIRKLFLISRPISWVNTAFPFAAAYLVNSGSINPYFFIVTLYFLIPYNLLMYGVNDVFDYESDMKNPRKGGIEGAREQKVFHPTIIRSVILLNLPFVIYILVAGTAASNVIFITLLFFVIAYSIARLRFKEIPLLDSITSSIHFVGPMIFGLVVTGFSTEYLPYVSAFFLWGMASHAFGAVQDILPDREGGLASIATKFGARSTMVLVVLLYSAASVVVVLQGWPAAVVGIAGAIYIINAAPFLRLTDKTSSTANKGWRRFIWLNLFVGFVTTVVLLYAGLAQH